MNFVNYCSSAVLRSQRGPWGVGPPYQTYIVLFDPSQTYIVLFQTLVLGTTAIFKQTLSV